MSVDATPERAQTPSGTDPAARSADLGRRAWKTICLHMDGIALAPTMSALHEAGLLERLSSEPVSEPGELAARAGVRDGYLAVALRLLELQGWLESAEPSAEPPRYRATPAGRQALGLGAAYARGAARLRRLGDYRRHLFGEGDADVARVLDDFVASRDLPIAITDAGLRHRFPRHLDGVVLVPLVFALYRRGLFAGLAPERPTLDLAEVEDRPAGLAQAFDVLAALGWVRRAGTLVRFADAGLAAVRGAAQYWYAAYYVDLLLATADLLFGRDPAIRKGTSAELEPLLDRELSIEFSGRVFGGPVGKPFLRLFLPVFNREPLSDQPRWLVDMGSGDGTMLRLLYRCVERHTYRGQHLARYPLTVIGAEYHEVARRATAETLAEAGIPHHVVPGDVDDPDALATELARLGIRIEDALHVSKSVIHNRVYRPPADREAARCRVPRTRWVPVAEDGSRIPLGDYEQSLVEHLARWRPHVGRFGMVVADPHTVAPQEVAANLGRTLMTVLEATHGYSNQYLVEADVFRSAAQEAGFLVPFHETAGAEVLGHDLVSVARLVTAGD